MAASAPDAAQRLRSLQRQVLCYLLEHREAKDTVEGIMQWWLADAQTPVRASDLSLALEDLVLRGWLTTTSLAHGMALYGLDKRRLDDVRDFLRDVARGED